VGLSHFLNISKALSDRTRVRALMALKNGELCLCQLVCLLLLAPSTLSKHMNLLTEAGLVERRKQGRWHYFRLAGPDAPPEVRRAIESAISALADDQQIQADRKRTSALVKKDLEELAACYRS
jgi:DNA-binding transcriptional ArsR family regulator